MDKQKTILIVDDLIDWRETLSGLLKDAGYETRKAKSREMAIQLLENEPFDLAVIDIRLDESNEGNEAGLELAGIIKERWPHVVTIIITGYETPETIRRAMEPNSYGKKLAFDFIPKNQTDELLSSIEKALGIQI
jgi:DNA-binding NtrC family response regulator